MGWEFWVERVAMRRGGGVGGVEGSVFSGAARGGSRSMSSAVVVAVRGGGFSEEAGEPVVIVVMVVVVIVVVAGGMGSLCGAAGKSPFVVGFDGEVAVADVAGAGTAGTGGNGAGADGGAAVVGFEILPRALSNGPPNSRRRLSLRSRAIAAKSSSGHCIFSMFTKGSSPRKTVSKFFSFVVWACSSHSFVSDCWRRSFNVREVYMWDIEGWDGKSAAFSHGARISEVVCQYSTRTRASVMR